MAKDYRLKVLQVLSGSSTCGSERYVFDLSRILHLRGHHVELVCPADCWMADDLRAIGIRVHLTDMRKAGWFRTAALVSKLAKRGKFDIIHSHLTRATYFGVVGSTLTGVPLVTTVHVASHDPIYKHMARGNNRLVAVSNFMNGLLRGRGISERYIDTVYNGTDFIEFDPHVKDGVYDEFSIPHNRRVVGMVGRVCREKGHLLMLHAMAEVLESNPELHVMFVGRVQDDFAQELRTTVSGMGLGDRITLTGSRNDVPRLLDAFEFTAMPSYVETFGLAAIESMARGKAVVATKVGGLKEIVSHQQTGLLVEHQANELADAVNYLLENREESEIMGIRGRMMVEERFTLYQMVERIEAVYDRALGRI